MSLSEDQIRIINESTNTKVNLVSWDSQIVEDRLSFSSWLLAISTAGLTSVVVQGVDIIGSSWLGKDAARSLIIAVGALLVLSLVIGGIAKYIGYETISLKRQIMSAWVAQRTYMFALSNIPDPLDDIISNMHDMKYVSAGNVDLYETARKKHDELISLEIIMYFQQAFTFAGIVLLVVCAMPAAL